MTVKSKFVDWHAYIVSAWRFASLKISVKGKVARSAGLLNHHFDSILSITQLYHYWPNRRHNYLTLVHVWTLTHAWNYFKTTVARTKKTGVRTLVDNISTHEIANQFNSSSNSNFVLNVHWLFLCMCEKVIVKQPQNLCTELFRLVVPVCAMNSCRITVMYLQWFVVMRDNQPEKLCIAVFQVLAVQRVMLCTSMCVRSCSTIDFYSPTGL